MGEGKRRCRRASQDKGAGGVHKGHFHIPAGISWLVYLFVAMNPDILSPVWRQVNSLAVVIRMECWCGFFLWVPTEDPTSSLDNSNVFFILSTQQTVHDRRPPANLICCTELVLC